MASGIATTARLLAHRPLAAPIGAWDGHPRAWYERFIVANRGRSYPFIQDSG